MPDKPNELKGNLKETAGKLTGNERMENEGRAEKDVAKTERKASGAWDRTKGSVKEGAGKLTGNEDMEAEGKWDKAKGKVKGL